MDYAATRTRIVAALVCLRVVMAATVLPPAPPAGATVTDDGALTGNDAYNKYNTVYYQGREIDRDCGFSNKLGSTNASLWVFCDSWVYDQLKAVPHN